jgi:RNA polymerase sigma-70 factor, ECF subfamily
MTTETDEALVRMSQAGRRQAFEELIGRTARLVYSRLYADVRDAHRAEDLTQETYLSAWRSIGQMTDPTGFRPWLMSIANSVLVDFQRRGMRKRRSGEPAAGNGAMQLERRSSAGAAPPDEAEHRESRQRLHEELNQLPEEYRRPLMLRYFGGADYETIGRQLGLSNGSLRGLLGRGLAMLRKRFTDE